MLKLTRGNFWAKNLPRLVGLTRYYSVSMNVDIKDAHPWMKITKQIARFGSPNDGVVTVESSHFPEGLQALDLGTIKGDHLAGIVASSFPQDAFLEAVMVSLFEIDAFGRNTLVRWYENVAKAAPLFGSGLLQTPDGRVACGSGILEPCLDHRWSGAIPFAQITMI